MVSERNNERPISFGILQRLGLQFKDTMRVSKLNIGALTAPDFDLKIRVWACILIKSCGYNEQLAVTQVAAERKLIVPLTPGAIANELNKATWQAFADAGKPLSDDQREALKIRKEHISRALAELETRGLIERVVANCKPHKLIGLTLVEAVSQGYGKILRELPLATRKRCAGGRVFVYLLAEPRAFKELDLDACLELANRRLDVTKNGNVSRKSNDPNGAEYAEQLWLELGTHFSVDPALLKASPELKREMDRYVRMEQDARQNELERQRQKAKIDSIAEKIAREPGSPTLSGKQKDLNFNTKASAANSNGNHSKKMSPPHVPSVEGSGVAAAAENRSAPSNPTGNGSERETSGKLDNQTRGGAETKLVSRPRSKVSEAEIYTLLEVMRRFGHPDDDAGKLMVMLCRDNAPQCTVVQIAEAIEAKGPYALKRRKADPAFNSIGFLLTAVPKMFEGAAGQQLAQETARKRGESHNTSEQQRAADVNAARLILESDDPLVDDSMREFARETLRKAAQSERAQEPATAAHGD